MFDEADTEAMKMKTGFGDTKFSDGYKKSAKHGEARLNAFQLPSDAGHNVQPSEAALKHLEPTDVEHAAKVQQKREKAKEALVNVAKIYKNTTDSKGFISDLSNSLGLTRGKIGSGYGSFETLDGKVFIIWVNNHNVNAANVGDEPVESIVIKTKRSPNKFHAEDGIQDILNSPTDVKLDTSKGRPTLLFMKQYDKYYVEMVSVGEDGTNRIVLHKSFFHRKKLPHKRLLSVAVEGSSVDEIPTISPASKNEAAGSSEFSALDDIRKNASS